MNYDKKDQDFNFVGSAKFYLQNMPRKKVLIIDDETDFCLLLKNYFVRKNYEVHISHTLSDGMHTLESIHPDILFLDNNLPDGLGWEKAEFITQHYSKTQVNLISAYQYNSSLTEQFPSVKIWEKPINISELNNYLS